MNRKYILVVGLLLIAGLCLSFRALSHKRNDFFFSDSNGESIGDGTVKSEIGFNQLGRSHSSLAPDLTASAQKLSMAKELAKAPFRADGMMSPSVRKVLNISDDQAFQISEAARNARLKAVNSVVSNLVKVVGEDAEWDYFEFQGDPEKAAELENELHRILASIVDQEFADNAMPALRTDTRFLGGGRYDVHLSYGYMDGVKSAKLELLTQDGDKVGHWSGPESNIRESLWVRFDSPGSTAAE